MKDSYPYIQFKTLKIIEYLVNQNMINKSEIEHLQRLAPVDTDDSVKQELKRLKLRAPISSATTQQTNPKIKEETAEKPQKGIFKSLRRPTRTYQEHNPIQRELDRMRFAKAKMAQPTDLDAAGTH